MFHASGAADSNPEFETIQTFDELGRVRKSLPQEEAQLGIAVLGDSQAMGWGVNDCDTFASLIQKGLKKPVYNLGVSSYGTLRELLRFQQAAVADKVDTILIQYSGNDLMENNAVDQEGKVLQAKKVFEQAVDSDWNSADAKTFQSAGRMLAFAIEKPIRNLRDTLFHTHRPNPFAPHYRQFMLVLKRFWSLLADKRILVFCVDESRFDEFPHGRDPLMKNVEFVDLNLEVDHFYPVDGHLNSAGHAAVAAFLTRYLSEQRPSL